MTAKSDVFLIEIFCEKPLKSDVEFSSLRCPLLGSNRHLTHYSCCCCC